MAAPAASALGCRCPAASIFWITAAPTAPFRFISNELWLLLRLQPLITAALQLRLYGLQQPLQLHLASFPMYYGCPASSVLWITVALQLQLDGLQLPCGFSSMDHGCARSFISLHFRCIVTSPAASAIWITAALQLQLS